jgi:hypothetical protein
MLLALLGAPATAAAQDAESTPAAPPISPSAEDGAQTPGVYLPEWAPPTTVYIPETGQTIDGWFLDLWRESGGAGAFGNPITPEFTLPNGHVVQYYDYARFEYWPEGNGEGSSVVLGDIGAELRSVAVPRLAFAGAQSMPAALTAEARAWLPLAEDEIQEDSPTWRYVPETGHSIYDAFKAFWEASGEQWYLGYPLTEEYTVDGVAYQTFERGQLAWRSDVGVYMVPVGRQLVERYGLSQEPVAQGDIPTYSDALFVPPAPLTIAERVKDVEADPNAERWMDVNLTTQSMVAYQGDVPIIESLVSTGKPRFETPTGTFRVNTKLPEQDMEGLIGGEYYNVAKVPDVMYFTDVGHAIHGAYWHNNFGTPMSHGCINLPLDVAEFIYEWAPMGMRVEIHK